MRNLGLLLLLSVLVLSACGSSANAQSSTAGKQKTIEDIGSDTIVNLALAWAEAYQKVQPDLRISVSGGGSGTGIAALLNKTTDIANASRQITDQEKADAQQNGIDPHEIEIARDAIGVIVNPTNPVQQLTLQQISDIYSGKITNWKDVGGEDRPIVLLSRESNSGTHVFFLANVVRLGNSKDKTLFSPDTLLLPSSEGIMAEVRQNPNAIGYDGLGYITPDVKTVAVAPKAGNAFVKPSVETVNNGTYPIARPLFMYTNGEPTGDVKTYIDWILGPDGQKIVGQLGFVPLK
ncbi:MAG TPA: PstS family phosphate ABC transporter substrate-binding protein [Anaerolineae bacterium]|nr:PstS family phosphate ABC transporter substrate-binding protein [Anaerolineae bacterium]